MKKAIIPAFILFCCSAVVFSSIAGSGLIVYRTIDWENGLIHLYINRAWKAGDGFTPSTKYIIDREIRENISAVFFDSVADMSIDSSHTIFDIAGSNGAELDLIRQFSLTGKNEGTSFSDDFKNIRTHYTFPLFSRDGLVSLFVRHTFPNSIKSGLGFIPADNFTGLVIYAKGEYPYYGENREGVLRPSFFPSFYDEDMNLIIDRRNCDPEYLKAWGMAVYTDKTDDIRFVKRIGGNPLRTMAAGIFGNNNCDIILPSDAAKKLLSREQNKLVLSQCRILVLIDPIPSTTEINRLTPEE